jgi:hypothetical protein
VGRKTPATIANRPGGDVVMFPVAKCFGECRDARNAAAPPAMASTITPPRTAMSFVVRRLGGSFDPAEAVTGDASPRPSVAPFSSAPLSVGRTARVSTRSGGTAGGGDGTATVGGATSHGSARVGVGCIGVVTSGVTSVSMRTPQVSQNLAVALFACPLGQVGIDSPPSFPDRADGLQYSFATSFLARRRSTQMPPGPCPNADHGARPCRSSTCRLSPRLFLDIIGIGHGLRQIQATWGSRRQSFIARPWPWRLRPACWSPATHGHRCRR